ncbi:MAG TPA: DUF4214 domain-containing protein, partial [Pyrinomonadaceae bacterium]|nr:DUF4214 domain-containing protein [Pyrinomonadaceae bacterium]
MKRVRRFPQRLVRWTSLGVGFALVFSCLVTVPLQSASGKDNRVRTPTRRGSDRLAQGQSALPNGKGQKVNALPPQPGPPEATVPNLDEARRKRQPLPEAPLHIPSSVRSRRNPLVPRNGLKVGDPLPLGLQGATNQPANSNAASQPPHLNAKDAKYSAKGAKSFPLRSSANSFAASALKSLSSLSQPQKGTSARSKRSELNHGRANARAAAPAPTGDDQFVQSFVFGAFVRYPTSGEQQYWDDVLRKAYTYGHGSMMIAARELGKTLFESAEYAARNRSNHDYVSDLYYTYLARPPDAGGWAFWEGQCNAYGREQVRRAFDECGEFAYDVAAVTPNGSASSAASSLLSARVDPNNQGGDQLLARDAEWGVGLLSLPGRSGLDLGLGLSYSSAAVWTHSGPYIYFDEDNGTPSPGFRLGFPTVQELSFDAQVGVNVYLLITPSGQRVELRKVGTSNVYEAADSSYLQLTDNSGSNPSTLLVRATDGTQMSYTKLQDEWRCTQIKDRNGNYLTVNYVWAGQIANITDTLGRVITFNYDGNSNLISITQPWNGATHTWATFGWTSISVSPGFS